MKVGVQRISFEHQGQDVWLDIRKPTAGELLDFKRDVQDDSVALETLQSFLGEIILDWNLEDMKGRKLKVKHNVIGQLPADLLVAIIQKVTEVLTEIPLVRKSSSTGQ